MDERWSCQKFVDARSEKTYFISFAHRAAQGDEGSADLVLTDGAEAWTAHGLTSDGIKGQGSGKLKHLLAALSELELAELEYKIEVVQEGGSLALRVSWQKSPTAPRVLTSVSLAPAVPAAPVLVAMLELLIDNLASLRTTCSDLLQQNKAFEQQAARSQSIVDDYVKNKEAHDREMNAKVAALLNSKKKKLRELQAQLNEAQEEIQRLKASGVEPMEEDMEGDDEGTADGSRQQQQQRRGGQRRLGRAAQVVDEDEEDEDGGEVDAGSRPQSDQEPDAEY